ncbi:MAG: hypothetical protein RLZ98_1376, partial [Pseudomonadota bacterium]
MSMTTYQQQEDPLDEGGFDLRDLVSPLFRRWRIIAAVTLLATAVAGAIAFSIPNQYTASASVQIDRRDKKIIHIDGVLSDLKADTPTLESEIEVIASPTIALRVIERLGLRSDPEFSRTPPADGVSGPHGAPSAAARDKTPASDDTVAFSKNDDDPQHAQKRDRVVQNFLNHMDVRRLRNSLVIEVRFTSRDPLKAARIANTIVDIYIERQFQEKRRANEIAVSLINEKLSGLRERLAASEREIARFKSANDIFDSKGHGLRDHQLASELEAVLKARNETAQARVRFEQAQRLAQLGGDPDKITELVQNDLIRQLRLGLGAARQRHAEIASRYGPLHPEMRKAQAALDKARGELKLELWKLTNSLKVEYEVAADREAQLSARFEELKGRVSTGTAQKWKLHDLEREAKANHQLYEVLLSRKKQAEETLGLHFPDAKFVAQAEIPLQASFPKRKNIVLIAFAAALALACGLAILLDQLAGGITAAEKIEQEFGLPHLASIPKLQRKEDGVDSPIRAMRLMLANPDGLYAEAIREIQYELDWRHHHQGPRIILVTSALDAEGKSLLASNLAHSLALTGHRTLLIDGDLRKQSLTTTLEAGGRNGLLEALCGLHDVRTTILIDDSTRLHFLPAAGTNAI